LPDWEQFVQFKKSQQKPHGCALLQYINSSGREGNIFNSIFIGNGNVRMVKISLVARIISHSLCNGIGIGAALKAFSTINDLKRGILSQMKFKFDFCFLLYNP